MNVDEQRFHERRRAAFLMLMILGCGAVVVGTALHVGYVVLAGVVLVLVASVVGYQERPRRQP